MSLESKVKTTHQIWFDKGDFKPMDKWVPLEEAQKLEAAFNSLVKVAANKRAMRNEELLRERNAFEKEVKRQKEVNLKYADLFEKREEDLKVAFYAKVRLIHDAKQIIDKALQDAQKIPQPQDMKTRLTFSFDDFNKLTEALK
jgi:hypothetical protein